MSTSVVQRLLLETRRSENVLRRYFNLPIQTISPTPPLITTFNPQYVHLLNYVYDIYVRLSVSGHGALVLNAADVATRTLEWTLSLLDPATTLTIEAVAAQLDDLRKTANIDVFADTCLDSVAKKVTVLSHTPPEPEHVQTFLLQLQTLYRPDFEDDYVDHTSHRVKAYVPFFRFGDSTQSSTNMSSYIGNTMRSNIRNLYDYIDQLISSNDSFVSPGSSPLISSPASSAVCPCVIIFNLFVRDNFRVFYSKSLRQTNFTQIDMSPLPMRKISYMLIANRFPKIDTWFNSINNQFIKKTGYSRILQTNSYIRILAEKCSSSSLISAITTTAYVSLSASRRRAISTTSLAIKKSRDKVTIAKLFTGVSGARVLSHVYRTGYFKCRHAHVERQYIQKRSHDEQASLVLVCKDCHRVV
nr:MAG: hypothetical protein [Apis mellifra filamentous-like virus]